MQPEVLLCALVLWCHATLARGHCYGCLILTPHIQEDAANARKMAKVESSNYLGLESYSGFLTVKEEYNSNLFFWFFPAQKEMSTSPWIIWLQGGPGFSSLKGLFDIVGPIKIEDDKVKLRNISWVGDYSVLFLDNPVGAGFSFTEDDNGYPDNQDDVGEQMLTFLHQFLLMFPELFSAPLFIAGQSYAGKYVPSLGIQIHRYNQRRSSKDKAIPLKGIAIGNGLIDMRSMMHYTELCKVIGIIDGRALDKLKALETETVRLIDENRLVDASNKFNETVEFIKKESGVYIYNFNEDPNKSVNTFEAYLNRPDVRKNIHVGNATFDLNNQYVYSKMLPDISNTTKPWVEELLDHYGVMLFSGQMDVILSYSQSRHLHAALKWSHREAYERATRKRIRRTTDGAVVGYKRSGGNLVEVLVRRAGHMVPYDEPVAGKIIIDMFIDEFISIGRQ